MTGVTIELGQHNIIESHLNKALPLASCRATSREGELIGFMPTFKDRRGKQVMGSEEE